MEEVQHKKGAVPPRINRFGVVVASFAALLVVVLVVFGSYNRASDDDLGIAFALSGLYPDSGLCLFVNAFISHFTIVVSNLFPGINAFFVIEYCLAALGVFVFAYAAIAFLDDHVVAFCTIGLLILLLVPACTFLKNFTVVATLITLAGSFVLVMQICQKRSSVLLTVVAVILCVFGFMMRWESFLLAMPFVFIAFAQKLWFKVAHKKPSTDVKGVVLKLVPIAAVFALCACAYVYDSVEWSSPEWSEWKAYNSARSEISDYLMPDYPKIETELSAGGITETDYYFAQSWRTADKDVFTVDSLEFIASFGEEVGNEAIAEKMLKKALSWMARYWYGIPIAVVLLVLYIMRARKLSAISNVAVIAAIVLFVVVTTYLASGGRLPQRVMYSLIANAVVCLAAIVGDKASIGQRYRDSQSSEKTRNIACALSLAFCVIAAGVVVVSSQPSLDGFGSNDSEGDFSSNPSITGYLRSNEDTLFVMDTKVEYHYLGEYDMKTIPPQNELMRIFLLGGWTTGSPFINARNEMMGMDNVMKGLVENERARYLVVKSNEYRVKEMEVFLETHYWNDVEAKLVDSFKTDEYEYFVYDFSVAA